MQWHNKWIAIFTILFIHFHFSSTSPWQPFLIEQNFGRLWKVLLNSSQIHMMCGRIVTEEELSFVRVSKVCIFLRMESMILNFPQCRIQNFHTVFGILLYVPQNKNIRQDLPIYQNWCPCSFVLLHAVHFMNFRTVGTMVTNQDFVRPFCGTGS